MDALFDSFLVQEPNISDAKRVKGFLTKRRYEILSELQKSGKLSQGELAKRLGIKPTALSNLLLQFEGFSPKLLKKEYVGKYCYYSLSAYGQNLMAGVSLPISISDSIQDKEDEKLFLNAKTAIAEMQDKFADFWQMEFDDVLIFYTRGCTISLNFFSKKLVNQYLQSLELLYGNHDDRLYNETLKLLPDTVIRARVADFMDMFFEPFSFLLDSLKIEELSLPISMALKAILTGTSGEELQATISRLGWKEEHIHKLKTVATKIRQCIKGYTIYDINDFLSALIPNQSMLCASISQWLFEMDLQKGDRSLT